MKRLPQTLLLLLLAIPALGQGADKPVLVLDPGHSPKQQGALGARGVYEVVYNDRFAAELKPALEQDGWQVVTTRSPGQDILLGERAELANRRQAKLFLSVHHDSAQLSYLKAVEADGRQAYQTIRPIRGYSLFVSAKNPQFKQSQQIASAIGRQWLALGREPAQHHAEPIEGENRPWLDRANGVYRYDGLAVLRQTKMPAVLLEVGVIVDSEDEAYVSDIGNRKAMIEAVVRGLRPYR